MMARGAVMSVLLLAAAGGMLLNAGRQASAAPWSPGCLRHS